MKGIVGRKLGMTQVFDEETGVVTPVTVIQAGPCPVVQIKTADADGYDAVQLAFDEVAERKVSKPRLGTLKKAGVGPHRRLVEIRGPHVYTEGETVTVETFEVIQPPPPLSDPSKMLFALVTESGLVPRGNPDRLPSATATHWAEYSIVGMDRLVPGEWDGVHGGYDNSAALQDPNRVVPLDAVRALEREGMIGQLLDELFVTVGNLGSLNAMKHIGAEIANTLVQRGVGAVILPAT